MNQHQADIADMQCWIFRMAQKNGTLLQRNVPGYSNNTIFLVL